MGGGFIDLPDLSFHLPPDHRALNPLVLGHCEPANLEGHGRLVGGSTQKVMQPKTEHSH